MATFIELHLMSSHYLRKDYSVAFAVVRHWLVSTSAILEAHTRSILWFLSTGASHKCPQGCQVDTGPLENWKYLTFISMVLLVIPNHSGKMLV